MKTLKNVAIATMMILFFLLTACSSTPGPAVTENVSPLGLVSPVATSQPAPTPVSSRVTVRVTPLPAKSALTGQVISAVGGSGPLVETVVRLARVFWNEQKTDGAFSLEVASSPSAVTDAAGAFFFANVEPADYVIVIGDLEGEHVILSNPDGSARIFTAEPNKIVDVGKLEVRLSR
ncbi:MAG: hypothetical protein ACOYZ7_12770 [Chloroflexota bacterium]